MRFVSHFVVTQSVRVPVSLLEETHKYIYGGGHVCSGIEFTDADQVYIKSVKVEELVPRGVVIRLDQQCGQETQLFIGSEVVYERTKCGDLAIVISQLSLADSNGLVIDRSLAAAIRIGEKDPVGWIDAVNIKDSIEVDGGKDSICRGWVNGFRDSRLTVIMREPGRVRLSIVTPLDRYSVDFDFQFLGGIPNCAVFFHAVRTTPDIYRTDWETLNIAYDELVDSWVSGSQRRSCPEPSNLVGMPLTQTHDALHLRCAYEEHPVGFSIRYSNLEPWARPKCIGEANVEAVFKECYRLKSIHRQISDILNRDR